MHPHLTALDLAPENAWFKSSYSDAGQNCVEASHLAPAMGIGIRDSKNPTGPALHLTPTTWTAFVTHLCAG
ncbi:DUF397 domain-containing protein [Streptomyces sp. ME02-8801-2C]|uniref:DUF397 domain-containing protein n=1 Tax=Streptomyces sp. ME02-8801-2C TaxID=3028680 RepID=UPI0029B15F25|nr:DUF397 domain-containing protein [Streptomyces sp. ME02-8801-2C]MDX3453038.1 DUF397 domain-containing protein [Streptomyces sp. ME02-8801-2C]